MTDATEHLVPDEAHRCRYVKTNGARCTAPALNRRELCFDHHRRLQMARGRLRPSTPATFNMVPLVNFVWAEDHHSILFNLNEIAEALSRGIIDTRQAGAMTSIMRTCLKALRQMRDIEKAVEPVRAYVEQDGLPLVVPADPPAPPPHPTLSFDPDTREGRYNINQEQLWRYFCKDPPAGIKCGLHIDWPGRPADYQPPTPDPSPEPDPATTPARDPDSASEPTSATSPESAAAAEQAHVPETTPDPDPAPQPDPVPETTPATASEPDPVAETTPDPDPGLTLSAVAAPLALTQAESIPDLQPPAITSLESTHTPSALCNYLPSHTYAKTRVF